MTADQFRQRAESDGILGRYLADVARTANPGRAQRSGIALGALVGVAAYALYRWAKNYFDHQRGIDEAILRHLMLADVEDLVRQGWDREQALAVVTAANKEVASLRPDSPALEAALALFKVGRATNPA